MYKKERKVQNRNGDEMKLFMVVLTALFPFLHEKSYKAEVVSCQKNQIVVKSEGSVLYLSLFNTKITDDKGWEMTCSLLEDANTVTFEIDPSSKIAEKLPVYLFADETLLQEELLKKGYAYPIIKNPQYTYEKRMEEAYNAVKVLAQDSKEESHSLAFQGPLYFGIAFLLWITIIFGYFNKQKKAKKRNISKI